MAVTMAEPYVNNGATLFLENTVTTNQTDNTRVVAKAVAVPQWARFATFYLNITVMTGTTPLLDFKLEAVDPIGRTAVSPLGSWDGITQMTTSGTTALVTVDVGPGLTVDDTGSATASCNYKVDAPLPALILYTITTDGTTDDEDYSYTLACQFKG